MTTLEKFLEIEQLIEKHVHNPLVAGLLADAFAAQVTEIEKLKAEMKRDKVALERYMLAEVRSVSKYFRESH